MASRRILLVEDDRDIRESLIDALEDSGYEVIPALDGLDALDRLRSGDALPGLILLDLMMPRMNGGELREEMEKDPRLSAIPVVVVTADPQARAKSEALHATGYLKKPVKFADLFSMLTRILGAPQS
jgi:CheY-like chemotaxis protein